MYNDDGPLITIALLIGIVVIIVFFISLSTCATCLTNENEPYCLDRFYAIGKGVVFIFELVASVSGIILLISVLKSQLNQIIDGRVEKKLIQHKEDCDNSSKKVKK